MVLLFHVVLEFEEVGLLDDRRFDEVSFDLSEHLFEFLEFFVT